MHCALQGRCMQVFVDGCVCVCVCFVLTTGGRPCGRAGRCECSGARSRARGGGGRGAARPAWSDGLAHQQSRVKQTGEESVYATVACQARQVGTRVPVQSHTHTHEGWLKQTGETYLRPTVACQTRQVGGVHAHTQAHTHTYKSSRQPTQQHAARACLG